MTASLSGQPLQLQPAPSQVQSFNPLVRLGPRVGPTPRPDERWVPEKGRDDGLYCRSGLANPNPFSQFQSQACCQLHQGAPELQL